MAAPPRATGNRAAALRAYARCRQVLVTELGIDPSPETEQAYLALLSLDRPAGVGSTGDQTELPPALRPRDDLPFVGRSGQLYTCSGGGRAS